MGKSNWEVVLGSAHSDSIRETREVIASEENHSKTQIQTQRME